MAARSQAVRRLLSYAGMAVETVVLRRVRPYMLILVINDKCNLDCFYCTGKNTGRYDLDDAAVRRALAEGYGRGHRALVITGGEPALWRSNGRDLADTIAYARGLGFLDVAVFTNGTFPLDAEGVTYIVTIDGTRAAHDRIRSGSYDRVIGHVRTARSKVIASMTLTRVNAEDLEEAVREIHATGLFAGITFNLLTHNPEVVARHGLVAGSRERALDRIWRLKKQGYPILLSGAAYRALRANDWKRPVRQIELFAAGRVFTCCRDVVDPAICRLCGYSSCAEISKVLDGRPSALWQLMKAK